MFRFLHAADFHLDSPFAALTPEKAAARRRESRELVRRFAEYANAQNIDLVLLAGDLLDSGGAYRETGELLRHALGGIHAPVMIAPGNHDWYDPSGVYGGSWPDNVHIFRTGEIESIPVPALGAVIHGAAFTAPEQRESLLAGFAAPEDGNIHLMVLHGELNGAEPRYDPLSGAEIAASGLTYLALGHIHKRTEPLQFGKTVAAWPGCPEGHGFDELGEKGCYEGMVDDDGRVTLQFVPLGGRRYEILRVDVTGREPAEAVAEALPADTARNICRIVLTGETGEGGADLNALRERFCNRFNTLELRDQTRMAEDVWRRADEDSLRGLFLRELRERLRTAQTDEERERVEAAARFGLAALDHRDLE
jgi:exonuclease SbcD